MDGIIAVGLNEMCVALARCLKVAPHLCAHPCRWNIGESHLERRVDRKDDEVIVEPDALERVTCRPSSVRR
jgi:hypothetical protein